MATTEALELRIEPGAAPMDSARLQVLTYLGRRPSLARQRRTIYAVELVLEEWLSNAFRHGGATQVGLQVSVDAEGDVRLRFEHEGPAFDPTALEPAPRPRDLDTAEPGGLGLLLIRQYASGWRYSREGARNLMEIDIAASGA